MTSSAHQRAALLRKGSHQAGEVHGTWTILERIGPARELAKSSAAAA
jgi:hypothetical protein